VVNSHDAILLIGWMFSSAKEHPITFLSNDKEHRTSIVEDV
jgi:hypothetical protein